MLCICRISITQLMGPDHCKKLRVCLCCLVEPELLDTVDMDEGPKPQTCPWKVAEVDWALLATQISDLSALNKWFTGVD